MLLSLHEVDLFIGGHLLLDGVSLTINSGDRVGVVGRNGCGKSHLMGLLAGDIPVDGGARHFEDYKTALLVKQDFPDEDQTPLDYVRSKDTELQELEAILEDETADPDTQGNAAQRLSELEDERYDTLAPRVLMGLGLTHEELTKPMRHLSGGMRMRINLAIALIRTPDLLLLDEPTNHLDFEASQWLIAYLKVYPARGAVVIVSHDLSVLRQVTTSTIHMRSGKLTQFAGDYRAYRAMLSAREASDERANVATQKQIDRHMDVYYRFRDLPESRAAQAVAQLRKAESKRGKIVEIVKEEDPVVIRFGDSLPVASPIIELKGVAIGYGSKKPILHDLNLSIQYGTKIGLLGQNGQGKSTLIRLLAGKLEPLSGDVARQPRLSTGYFSQDLMEELNGDLSVYEEFSHKSGLTVESVIRARLLDYGFPHDKLGTLVKELSGGEKSRLVFCLIFILSPSFIILDEPTNHLDVETREMLTAAIRAFEGTVVLVSHDADLHQETMQKFWLVKDGAVIEYEPGLVHYQTSLQCAIDGLGISRPAHTVKAAMGGSGDSGKPGDRATKKMGGASASSSGLFAGGAVTSSASGGGRGAVISHKKGGEGASGSRPAYGPR